MMKVGMKVMNVITHFVGEIVAINDDYATVRASNGRLEYALLAVLTEV